MLLDQILALGICPDFLLRIGIRFLLARKLWLESRGGLLAREERYGRLLEAMENSPLALETDAANVQHYEIPAKFFLRVLGRHLKYSSGYWPEGVHYLDASEEAMLDLTAERAGVRDGQSVLELGCGWGSLTLYLAARFPGARITAVSNSVSQKAFIDEKASEQGLGNIRVITSDINHLELRETFDRVVSVEMFEHVRNYRRLFEKIAGWLCPGGLLFFHIFCHRQFAYFFEKAGKTDWLSRHFFSGGMMPSFDLPLSFLSDFELLGRWEVNGLHYHRTCEAWLRRMDAQRPRIMEIFREVYGPKEARKFTAYWRIFFLACSELFRYRGGSEWFVAHYLFQKAGGRR